MVSSRQWIIEALFAGGTVRLEPEGEDSGIRKSPVLGRIAVGALGLAGDVHCDRRVHGGPEKAVHQFAVCNYSRMAAHVHECANALVAGSIGENITASGMDETSVHIGDIYRAGTVLLEVSQPRTPCWKIDRRFGVDGLAAFIARERIGGWYYRVLEVGHLEVGSCITLEERKAGSPSVDYFWQVQLAHRPDMEQLNRLAAAQGLSPVWQQRLRQRLDWLRSQR